MSKKGHDKLETKFDNGAWRRRGRRGKVEGKWKKSEGYSSDLRNKKKGRKEWAVFGDCWRGYDKNVSYC